MTRAKTPDRLEHDAGQRLVAAHFDSRKAASPDGPRWAVAVDGSDYALRATMEAVKYASNVPGLAIDFIVVAPPLSKEAASDLGQHGWAVSEPARALAQAAGVPWSLHVRMGEPAEEIVAQAQASGCSVIALGTHGRGAVQTMLMGSVALEVLRLARCSVLVVR